MIRSFYQRIKLFSRNEGKEFYLFLKDVIGIYPSNSRLYDIAFTHRSASVTDSLGTPINNERLEYLGDAVLGAIVAEFLYKRFPQRDEGFLTQMRSKLVNRTFMSELMIEMGLDQFVRSRKIGNKAVSSIYGDALEALIGAIYLDKGYETSRHIVVKKILNVYVDLNKVEEVDQNFKSQLIEWGQKNKVEIDFKTSEEITNNKNNLFTTTVIIDNETKGKGVGISKKVSQQNAAHEALKKIDPDL
ncbi:MAG: ribonuclease III [Prolixibacteraceae bacterium]|jgi:ribonuclease-3|nr:ribonuclease III [Prolixibacteraceae bacterium]